MYYEIVYVFEMFDDYIVFYRLNKRYVLYKVNILNLKMFLVGFY